MKTVFFAVLTVLGLSVAAGQVGQFQDNPILKCFNCMKRSMTDLIMEVDGGDCNENPLCQSKPITVRNDRNQVVPFPTPNQRKNWVDRVGTGCACCVMKDFMKKWFKSCSTNTVDCKSVMMRLMNSPQMRERNGIPKGCFKDMQ